VLTNACPTCGTDLATVPGPSCPECGAAKGIPGVIAEGNGLFDSRPAFSETVGIDSNCLSYIIDVLEGVPEPADELARQKSALARLFFYRRETLWATPTVKAECLPIRNARRRALHESWMNVHFGPLPLNNPERVKTRAVELQAFHGDKDDCTILAEAEDMGFDVLLSYDEEFIDRLGKHSEVRLMKPAPYWESLKFPRGSPPSRMPAYGNPLGWQSWWRW